MRVCYATAANLLVLLLLLLRRMCSPHVSQPTSRGQPNKKIALNKS